MKENKYGLKPVGIIDSLVVHRWYFLLSLLIAFSVFLSLLVITGNFGWIWLVMVIGVLFFNRYHSEDVFIDSFDKCTYEKSYSGQLYNGLFFLSYSLISFVFSGFKISLDFVIAGFLTVTTIYQWYYLFFFPKEGMAFVQQKSVASGVLILLVSLLTCFIALIFKYFSGFEWLGPIVS